MDGVSGECMIFNMPEHASPWKRPVFLQEFLRTWGGLSAKNFLWCFWTCEFSKPCSKTCSEYQTICSKPYVWHMISKHDFWNHYCPKPILQNQILPNHLQFFKHVSSNRMLSNHIFPTKFWNHCAPHAIEPQLLNQHLFKHVSFTFILLIVLISGQHIVSIFVRNHFPTSWVIPPLGLSFMFRMLECNHGVYFP